MSLITLTCSLIRSYGPFNELLLYTTKCKVLVEGREIIVPVTGLSEATGTPPAQHAVRSQRPAEPKVDIIVPGELNVVGQRVDPALSEVERYLNDASMSGMKEVRIIHGIGAGILAKAIREFLEDHPLVGTFRKGSEDEGGAGVTVVVF